MRWLALLGLAALAAACATDPEEREVHFPKGESTPCERPDPHPALAVHGPGVLSSSFRPQGPGRAVETARLAGAVYLQIRHETCTRNSQTFRFYLPKAELLSDGAASAYGRAADLIDSLAAAGGAGAPLRELSAILSLQAAKGAHAPPFGTRLELGEFQELLVSRSQADETSAYGTVIVVVYRLKV
ncbi:hypothetical protein EPO15_17795 [bacterium]|nr:MAG: hypothetical protein EPO15_17795 [bacterium]